MSSGTSQNKREKLIIYEARFCPQQCILKQCLFVIGVPGSEHVFIRV